MAKLRSSTKHLKVTSYGIWFIVLALAVGFAAVNTGLNLLFLILGMMLSMIVASGILSMISLKKIALERSAPEKVRAGESFPVRIQLVNRKRLFASYSLRISEGTLQRAVRSSKTMDQTQQKNATAYCLKLPPGSQMTLFYEQIVWKRGYHDLGWLVVSTSFPFSFFLKSQVLTASSRILAYPLLGEIPAQTLEQLDRTVALHAAHMNALSEDAFYGIREYRPGDNPRWIHWKSSARLQREMVKEFEREERERVMIFLDTCMPLDATTEQSKRFEDAVSFAATLACHYIEEGHPVGLACFTPAYRFLPAENTQEHLDEILTTLALVSPATNQTLLDLIHESREAEGAFSLVIGLTLTPPPSLPLDRIAYLTPHEPFFIAPASRNS